MNGMANLAPRGRRKECRAWALVTTPKTTTVRTIDWLS